MCVYLSVYASVCVCVFVCACELFLYMRVCYHYLFSRQQRRILPFIAIYSLCGVYVRTHVLSDIYIIYIYIYIYIYMCVCVCVCVIIYVPLYRRLVSNHVPVYCSRTCLCNRIVKRFLRRYFVLVQ